MSQTTKNQNVSENLVVDGIIGKKFAVDKFCELCGVMFDSSKQSAILVIKDAVYKHSFVNGKKVVPESQIAGNTLLPAFFDDKFIPESTYQSKRIEKWLNSTLPSGKADEGWASVPFAKKIEKPYDDAGCNAFSLRLINNYGVPTRASQKIVDITVVVKILDMKIEPAVNTETNVSHFATSC